MLKNLTRIIIAGQLMVIMAVPTVLAAPYGSGDYGECAYQTGCPTPPPAWQPTTPAEPTPTPPTTPQPAEPPAEPKKSVTVQLPSDDSDGDGVVQVIAVIDDLTNQDGQSPNGQDVGWVAFYVDDEYIGTTYSPDQNGNYVIDWNAATNPGQVITAVAYGQNGAVLARGSLEVDLDKLGIMARDTQDSAVAGLGPVGRWLNQLPEVVIYQFPYWLFLILTLLGLRMAWQAGRETLAHKRMLGLLRRQKTVSEAKDNFIALASHYLHTPLTVMRSGADTMQALKEVDDAALQPLLGALDQLKQRIDQILEEIESNKILGGIKEPDLKQAQLRSLTSPLFWMPLAIIGGLVILGNLLLGLVGQVDLGWNNLLAQMITFLVIAGFMYAAVRTQRLRRQEREKAELLIDYQRAIDQARNNFISQSTLALRDGLSAVDTARTQLPTTNSSGFVGEGRQRFADILDKFDMVTQLKAGADFGQPETFDLSTAVAELIANYQTVIDERGLKVANQTLGIQLNQHRALLGYVLHTVLDNAIKFTPDGGQVVIDGQKTGDRTVIRIKNDGDGIAAEKLTHLFQPFSRTDSALQFDHEGLGFSLYLDKIIMDYLGGDIGVESKAGQPTVITISV